MRLHWRNNAFVPWILLGKPAIGLIYKLSYEINVQTVNFKPRYRHLRCLIPCRYACEWWVKCHFEEGVQLHGPFSFFDGPAEDCTVEEFPKPSSLWAYRMVMSECTWAEVEESGHLCSVTLFLDLLIHHFLNGFPFSELTPCPFYKAHVLAVAFSPRHQLRQDYSKAIYIDLLVHLCCISIPCHPSIQELYYKNHPYIMEMKICGKEGLDGLTRGKISASACNFWHGVGLPLPDQHLGQSKILNFHVEFAPSKMLLAFTSRCMIRAEQYSCMWRRPFAAPMAICNLVGQFKTKLWTMSSASSHEAIHPNSASPCTQTRRLELSFDMQHNFTILEWRMVPNISTSAMNCFWTLWSNLL